MVDWFGQWTEEKDYSQYPKEKWCDYDYMAAWIREQGYEPRTEMENLITNIFSFYESDLKIMLVITILKMEILMERMQKQHKLT